MNNRQKIQALLAGEKLDTIPLWLMGFCGYGSAGRVVPKDLLYPFYEEYPENGEYGFGAVGTENLDKQIRFNAYIDRCAFPVGRGANASFGHGGPGEFNKKVVEKGENYFLVEYETGAKKEVRVCPNFSHTRDLPVTTEGDLEKLILPDPADPGRYEGVKEDAAYAKSRGEWTVGWINGIFSAIHYFFMDYQEFLANLALEPGFMKKLIEKAALWTLTAEEMLCRAGVDCIGFCDDLGSNESLLISPEMYREFVLPWHRKICDIAHGHGVRVHMHTHGNVMPVLKDIVNTGVDIINPLDPDDKMDLDPVRGGAGKKIILCGGMDKHFFDWEEAVQLEFLQNLTRKGRDAGPFILMDSAGVPDNVTKDRFDAFMRMYRSVR